ncbi:hypothetical protein BD777DRAFT_124694 [Yarrowia lipolytica]|uniref:Secreted protein n=1 Tax=Yarrowia lipolytica TaxID=4952 RepID=A0A371C5J4_YARLL|nr:hypothetical protein B0I71DRAFT_132300 [Yarrowia lipolytica]RMI98572.1 hypothetical protein BD777DRAFT_124694 [Yarrowia lipolytica]
MLVGVIVCHHVSILLLHPHVIGSGFGQPSRNRWRKHLRANHVDGADMLFGRPSVPRCLLVYRVDLGRKPDQQESHGDDDGHHQNERNVVDASHGGGEMDACTHDRS